MIQPHEADAAARLEAAFDRWERDQAGRDAALAQALDDLRALTASMQQQAKDFAGGGAAGQELLERDRRIAVLEATVTRLEQDIEAAQRAREAERSDSESTIRELQSALREREARITTLEHTLRVSPTIAAESLHEQIPAFDERGHKKRMGQILVDLGIATPDELSRIIAEQAAHPQRRFGMIAIEHGLTDEELIGRIIAAQSKLEFVRLSDANVDPGAVRLLNRDLAQLYEAVPIRNTDGRITVAMANPMDLIAIENIELATNFPVDPVVATPRDIEIVIRKYTRH